MVGHGVDLGFSHEVDHVVGLYKSGVAQTSEIFLICTTTTRRHHHNGKVDIYRAARAC